MTRTGEYRDIRVLFTHAISRHSDWHDSAYPSGPHQIFIVAIKTQVIPLPHLKKKTSENGGNFEGVFKKMEW